MQTENNNNDLQTIITQALLEMKQDLGDNFDLDHINLAELGRRTNLSRGKLRRLKKNGFIIQPSALKGKKAVRTVLTEFTGVIDDLLRQGITNSSVHMQRIQVIGYKGSLSTLKAYIAAHKDLVPAKSVQVAAQGNRGRRYHTDPGENYQMDWGFVNVATGTNASYRVACFAMICHHCGQRFIEFFPNAKQENLFIGMLHGFAYMGIPQFILTDNMKSVVTGRDPEGHPIWQTDYEQFMKTVGFQTRLCKPRHPFTKGAVERLIRFVKDNFLAGRVFGDITDLNYEAIRWCDQQNSVYHQAVDCVPDEKHSVECLTVARQLQETHEIARYLCPLRKISFDGFVNYEGRRFGVPYWYPKKICRIRRQDYTLCIYNDDLTQKLTEHPVTWSRKDSFCKDQYVTEQPEELPTVPVHKLIQRKEPDPGASAFDKFNFDREVD